VRVDQRAVRKLCRRFRHGPVFSHPSVRRL
jgi:hypothetical protein